MMDTFLLFQATFCALFITDYLYYRGIFDKLPDKNGEKIHFVFF